MKRILTLAIASAMILAACGGTELPEPYPTAPAPTTTEMPDMPEMEHDEHEEEAEHQEDEIGEALTMRAIDVVMDEFTITPFTVEEGETVVFNVRNDGVLPHEFRFGSADDSHEHEESHDGMEMDVLALEPGEAGSITITFDGTYTEVACRLVGHYEAGMFTPLS